MKLLLQDLHRAGFKLKQNTDYILLTDKSTKLLIDIDVDNEFREKFYILKER